MAQFRDPGSPSLQELIDSYNDQIMRYSRMAAPEDAPPAAGESPSVIGEAERERGEFEAESGNTERSYWQKDGKYAVQRSENQYGGEVIPAAEPYEQPAADETAVFPPLRRGSDAPDEREQWVLELRQGLEELRLGLKELAEGQLELQKGLLEYKKGIAEREAGNDGQPRYSENEHAPFFAAYHDAAADTVYRFYPPDDGFRQQPVPDYLPDTPPAQSAESIPSDGAGFGTLQAAVYTARQSQPIQDALVRIFADSPQGRVVYATARTDADGKTLPIRLPAGTASAPDAGYAVPYTRYSAVVSADGYYPRNDLTAQIFNGVAALLPVELTPIPDTAPGIQR